MKAIDFTLPANNGENVKLSELHRTEDILKAAFDTVEPVIKS